MNTTLQKLTNDYFNISDHVQELQNSSSMTAEQLEFLLSFSQTLHQQFEMTNASAANLSALLSEVLMTFVSSCAALPPSSPSGHYWIRALNGSVVRVYCDMTRRCGSITGGWMRVAQLDMTNRSHQCPSGLWQRTDYNIRTCISPWYYSSGCSSVYFTSHINYTNVCGRVIAYQFGDPNAFHNNRALNSAYVDGVSLTHGSPREHIWAFAAAASEAASSSSSYPCIRNGVISRASARIPSFVEDTAYFCDTGTRNYNGYIFHRYNPLWDGAGCGFQNTCCSFNNPPWFYRDLPESTADDIEMRVCTDGHRNYEDIAIQMVDIYVQ